MVSQNLNIQKILEAKQLIVVTTTNWRECIRETLFFLKKTIKIWLAKKSATAVIVGKNGLA